MKARKIILITLAALSLLGIALGWGLRKTITLNVDGQALTVTSYALTVGGLLKSEAIPLAEQDALDPALDSWLKNGQTITLVRAIPVQIWADSRLVELTSSRRQPAELLAQAGLVLGEQDGLFANGRPHPFDQAFPAGVRSISLQIVRGIEMSVTIDGRDRDITSRSATLGQALWEAGIPFTSADRLIPPASTEVLPGLQAELQHARQVTIQTAAGDLVRYTPADTVGEALVDAGLALQGLDYCLPGPDEPLPSDGVIRLVRVREEVLIENTPLPFEVQYQPVADLALDSQTILQTGEYGLTAARVRIRYEDGAEVSRSVESEWVARPPQPRIVGYGTQITMQTTTVDGVTIQYWRAITMWATSYHPSEVGNITASGLPLAFGVAAVDTNYVPFYTRMYVPGYGEVIAADRGGGVIGRWIDLGYSDEDYVPWHSYVTVYFLWPPPAEVVWIFP